jgi:hypothetical protein
VTTRTQPHRNSLPAYCDQSDDPFNISDSFQELLPDLGSVRGVTDARTLIEVLQVGA